MNLALNCWFSQCYNTRILTAKLSPYYFTYLLFNLRFIIEQQHGLLQTIRLFISEWDGRWDMRLASDNSWARRRLKHILSWRSRWIILCTLKRRMAVSCEISRADRCFLACPPDWAQGPPLLRDVERGLPLPVCRNYCTRLVDSLKQTVDASSSPTVGKFTQRPSCTISFWQIEILSQNLIFLWNFHDSVYFFLHIFRSRQFPKVK